MKLFGRIISYGLALSFLLFGLGMAFLGFRLITVGGSWFFLPAGLALIYIAWLTVRGSRAAPAAFGIYLGVTLIFSLFEAGLDFWAHAPRLGAFSVMGTFLLIPVFAGVFAKGDGKLAELGRTPLLGALGAVLVLMAASSLFNSKYISNGTELSAPPASAVSAENETVDWPHHGKTAGGTRFGALTDITPENVGQLEEVWRVRTKVPGTFKGTPIKIGDTLYLCGATSVVMALNAETGEELWRFDGKGRDRGLAATCRGVSHYVVPELAANAPCKERIFSMASTGYLYALDAKTGQQCPGFADNGTVDLLYKMGDFPRDAYYPTSAPLIAGDVVVVGSGVREFPIAPSGVVRAYDPVTGELAWAWDMGRPGEYGEPGEGEIYTPRTPNVWTNTSYDAELNLVYLPVANATVDYLGYDRTPEMEKYSTSVTALNADTGEPVWTYQIIHHDIFDYDLPSQPVLFDVTDESGATIPALAQPTKQGDIFLLDRRDGTPIADVEERPVSQNTIPTEYAAPTQPFSKFKLSYFEDLYERDMWGATPLDHIWCRIQFNKKDYEGAFTPGTVRGSLQHPGFAGGYNWGSVSVHEDQSIVVGLSLNLAQTLYMKPMEPAEDGRERYRPSPEFFFSPLVMPCQEPPFGILAAYDMNKQELMWSRPLGSTREMGPLGMRMGLDLPMGVPTRAGVLVTQTGLIFVGGTNDNKFRAVDLYTGKTVWTSDLPSTAEATPMTYRSPETGRQYIILPVQDPKSGMAALRSRIRHGGDFGEEPERDPEGGYVIAYALPQ